MPDGYNINDSIAQILTSIAMEEIGLSHIINAEGEKIQYVLGTLEGQQLQQPPTVDQILEVNESVKDMLSQVSFSQMFLMGKMQAALGAYKNNPNPPTPPVPANIFAAAGTGRHEVRSMVNSMIVPFGLPSLQIGNDISYTADYDFIVQSAGRYQIDYQLSANEPGGAGFINMRGELTSNNLGIIDSFNFPQDPFILMQRSVTTDLQMGDRVKLSIRKTNDADMSDIEAVSQAITFIKVN